MTTNNLVALLMALVVTAISMVTVAVFADAVSGFIRAVKKGNADAIKDSLTWFLPPLINCVILGFFINDIYRRW